jgi:hypothetical protein
MAKKWRQFRQKYVFLHSAFQSLYIKVCIPVGVY